MGVLEVNILIVEDNTINQVTLKHVLKPLGYNVYVTENGMEALQALKNREFAVILMDVEMPELNGFETAHIIRQQAKHADVPIIFITGVAKDSYRISRGYELKAIDYIFKPVDKNILRAKVEVLVDYYKKNKLIALQAQQIENMNRKLSNTNEQLVSMNKQLSQEIQERQLVEFKLSESLKDLAYKNKELKDFAYIVSHDLKSPLRAISSLSEWMIEDYADILGEEGREQLFLLKGRVKRMNCFIEGILLYSRIGRLKTPCVKFDLYQSVEGIIDLLSPPKHIRVKIDGKLPKIIGEQLRIEQVFQNLIDNAIKFIDKPQGEVHVSYERKDNYYLFKIQDNGIGIHKRYFEKIFKMFQTLIPRDVQESSGIGLSIVKKIVENQGGQIWLESEFGVGTTFYFTLPRRGHKYKAELANAA